MLIDTTEINFSDQEKQIIIKKYGSIVDIPLPKTIENAKKVAENYFFRITASFDSCANTPKQNIVVIDNIDSLNKLLIDLLKSSEIDIISKKSLFLEL